MKVFNYENILEQITRKNIALKFLYLLVGAFIVALSYNSFTVPNDLVSGGVSGLAILINDLFNIPEVVFINVVTVSLLIISFILLGPKKTSYAIVGFLFYTCMINLTQPLAQYFSIKFSSFLLSILFYATVSGIGYGLIYRTGFNTGGSDTIVMICQKYFRFPIAYLSDIINGIIIILGAAVFGVTKSIYAVIFLKVSNFVADMIILGASDNKLCLIKTRKTKEVEEYITNELEMGYTLIESTNGIGLLKKYVIFCIVPSDRFYDLRQEVIQIDKKAELISTDCYTVEGGKTNHFMRV